VSGVASVVVRAYRDADEPAVTALWTRDFHYPERRNQPARAIEHKRHVQPELFLVAELSGDVVGTTMAGYDGHRAWVYLVAVAPEHRKLGIGRRLMAEAVARLRRLGAPKLNLQVNTDNAGVVGFYEKLGFHVENRVSMGLLLEGPGSEGA
jgi:ribosomal protein S18 acetylase RimI-like enzyme